MAIERDRTAAPEPPWEPGCLPGCLPAPQHPRSPRKRLRPSSSSPGSVHRKQPSQKTPAARCQATECCLNTTPHLGPPTGLAGRREEGQGEALAGTAPGGSSGEPRQAPSVPESEQMGGKTDSLACGRQTEREAGGKASVSPCHVLEGPPGVFLIESVMIRTPPHTHTHSPELWIRMRTRVMIAMRSFLS